MLTGSHGAPLLPAWRCVAVTGIVLEDLQAPPQQQFEQLRVTDPRLYFKTMQQQQQQSSQPQSQPQQQQGHATLMQQQDPTAAIGSIDPGNLLDPPVTSAVARQVRTLVVCHPSVTCTLAASSTDA